VKLLVTFHAGPSGDQEYDIPDRKASELMDSLRQHRVGSRHQVKDVEEVFDDEGPEESD
jgi:hypothetical protein